MSGRPAKVSVVVPTYCAPVDGLDRLVASLDGQSLPADEFEVIFVDDGSTDDTWARLERVRDTHSNVRLERIENSGWPSRPRNVGLELATGEYVLFMDHDDELYPDALRAGYALAARTKADVLNGKETRTDQPKWAVEVYPHNFDNAVDRTDVHPLVPTNPHKLFRRELLMTHDIRFPEGRRVLWEDVFFCLDVAPHAEVIAVLADTPFYHWVRGAQTASSSYVSDRPAYWRWLREIVMRTNETLAGPRLATQRRLMLLHQYRSRVLSRLDPELFDAPHDDQRLVRDAVTDLLTRMPEELDGLLGPVLLGRAVLARAGRWDLLRELVQVDAGLLGVASADEVRWRSGRLQIRTTAHWTAPDGAPLALRRDGERIVRDLPAAVAAALPDAALDMTDALAAATTTLSLRGRDSAVTWMLPTTSEVEVRTEDGRPDLLVHSSTDLDPRTAQGGRPIEERAWDLYARCELSGAVNQRRLRTAGLARTAVTAGHVFVAYENKAHMLSLDVDEKNRTLAGSAPLQAHLARITAERTRRLGRWRVTGLEIPFSGVATNDGTVLAGRVRLGESATADASIVSRPDGAWLRVTLPELAPGRYPLFLEFFGRVVDGRTIVTLDRRYEAAVTADKP